MPLPQKVVDQLGREPVKTPGLSFGLLALSGGLLFAMVFIYCGIAYVYEPYVNSEVNNQLSQIGTLNQSISSSDQAKLITFYSQISNVKTLLANHVLTSQFFAWLEKNTEANVYFTSLSLTSGNQLTMSGTAASEADVNQQIAIFEAAPELTSVSVANVSPVPSGNGWTFSLTLIANPSLFLRQ